MSKPKLDDVAVRPPDRNLDLTLGHVGLENVQMQVSVDGRQLPARGAAGVSLIDRHSRGIHMSRLFRILTDFGDQPLSWAWLDACLDQMLESQGALSDAIHFEVSFDLPVKRRALLSELYGWRNYGVTYRAERVRGARKNELGVRVIYSSTCPCSASLSRQALQDLFKDQSPDVSADRVLEWLGVSSAAIPHSQRSEAYVRVVPSGELSALDVIDYVEAALGTPVQTAVKREDEQEFARLNAKNLMFCEDAARKLKAAFLKRGDVADFAIEVRHFESLHPHDVVAKASRHD